MICTSVKIGQNSQNVPAKTTVWILGYPVGAQFRTVERPAEGLAAVRLDAWAQGRADASLPALVLHGLHADRPAPSRPPHARERLRGGFDVWGDDGDADDAERGDAVVEKRGERAQSTSARP